MSGAVYQSWTRDRFMLFLVAAVAVHAAVMFGVHFGFNLSPPKTLADTLDVVLVQWKSETTPEEADYLAQASREGGGDENEKARPSDEVSAAVPNSAQGQESAESPQQLPTPTVETREVLAVEKQDQVQQVTSVETPELDQPNAAELMRQSMQMASLTPELSRQSQWKSELPRREFISASTRQYEFASYMSGWVAKVERVGNMNYPMELRAKKLHGDLILTVGIYQNGTVESIEVKRSSGNRAIDDAAIDIVQMAAPYAPLPDNIAERVDILHITRTWRFARTFATEAPGTSTLPN